MFKNIQKAIEKEVRGFLSVIAEKHNLSIDDLERDFKAFNLKPKKKSKTMSGHNLFIKRNFSKVREEEGTDFKQTNAILNDRWRKMSSAEKQRYTDDAKNVSNQNPSSEPEEEKEDEVVVPAKAKQREGEKKSPKTKKELVELLSNVVDNPNKLSKKELLGIWTDYQQGVNEGAF